MGGSVFVIQELRQVGAVIVGSENPDGAERFEWFGDLGAINTSSGRFAAPRKPWTIGGELRGPNTYYPGAKTPSRQVLGPKHKPQTFRGSWDDRWNVAGYALGERARFVAMCERGAFVRLSFESEVWEGYVTSWDATYQRSWDIPYEFTFDPSGRPEDRVLANRAPATVPSVSDSFNALDTATQALLDTHRTSPSNDLSGTIDDDVLTGLSQMAIQRDDISDSLDASDFSGSSISQLRQLATKMRTIHGLSADLVTQLADLRADNDLVTLSAIRMLDFEDWSRSLRFQARVAMGQARLSANELEERTDGRAERIYRVQTGENLYGVSTRFYGTPHGWSLIADRNNLSTFKVEGGTLLMIPERGQG